MKKERGREVVIGLEFHHIGVIAKEIEYARRHMSAIFCLDEWTEVVEDPLQCVKVTFGMHKNAQGPRYEVISPLNSNSPISSMLGKKQNIINHVAYMSHDFDAARHKMRENGCMPITQPKPAAAFDGQRICFYLSPMTFVFELIEGKA